MPPATHSLQILLADDHTLFRLGMESLLLKINRKHKITTVHNGKEALDKLVKNNFDLLLTDILMPEMNGIELTREIRKSNKELMIIALTMVENPDEILKMFKAGANGYLLKSSSTHEVSCAINEVMNGNRYFATDVTDILIQHLPKPRTSAIGNELTPREKEIVKLICKGYTSKQIGDMLFISLITVESHRAHIYSKLKINKIADLICYAMQHKIITMNSIDGKD